MYRLVIDLTIAAVAQRAKNFRNQVVTLVLLSLVAAIGAIVLYNFLVFTFLIVLIPVCGLFLWFDTKLIAHWRSMILSNWAQRNIELNAFDHAMRAVPKLPESTINSMLDSLSILKLAPLEAQASTQTRQAIATVMSFIDRFDLHQLAVKVCASAIIAGSVVWSTATQSWTPLGLIVMVLLVPLVSRWNKLSLLRKTRAAVATAKLHPDFDVDIFGSLVQQQQPHMLKTAFYQ